MSQECCVDEDTRWQNTNKREKRRAKGLCPWAPAAQSNARGSRKKKEKLTLPVSFDVQNRLDAPLGRTQLGTA